MNIEIRVHELYWKNDINCARTMLILLSEIFEFELDENILHAAIGMHGAGGYRAQCGLVEGALMFMGLYGKDKGKTDAEISELCYKFAEGFERYFGSLSCNDLRPNGFSEDDPPHACEQITADAVRFSRKFIQRNI